MGLGVHATTRRGEVGTSSSSARAQYMSQGETSWPLSNPVTLICGCFDHQALEQGTSAHAYSSNIQCFAVCNNVCLFTASAVSIIWLHERQVIISLRRNLALHMPLKDKEEQMLRLSHHNTLESPKPELEKRLLNQSCQNAAHASPRKEYCRYTVCVQSKGKNARTPSKTNPLLL